MVIAQVPEKLQTFNWLRIGTNEVTRLGFMAADMATIAESIARVLV